MEQKFAIIGIFVTNPDSVATVNNLLHECSDSIVGRIGVPCRDKGVSVISVILNADANTISALAGKLGRLDGVTAKSMQAGL